MAYPSPEPGRARSEDGAGGRPDPAAVHAAAREVARQLSADPQRVAHELADQITHRLFAVSLELHGALARIHDPHAAQRVHTALAGLDDTLTELRHVIFDLHATPGGPG